MGADHLTTYAAALCCACVSLNLARPTWLCTAGPRAITDLDRFMAHLRHYEADPVGARDICASLEIPVVRLRILSVALGQGPA